MCHQATTYQAAADAAAASDRRCCVLFDISITRPATTSVDCGLAADGLRSATVGALDTSGLHVS